MCSLVENTPKNNVSKIVLLKLFSVPFFILSNKFTDFGSFFFLLFFEWLRHSVGTPPKMFNEIQYSSGIIDKTENSL